MASKAQSESGGDLSSQVYPSIGKKLYLKDECADFNFVFNSNDGQCIRVPAHKLLLTTASDVFRTMFNGSWNENDEVEIVDASMDAFKEFLQFFYLSTVKLTVDNVAEVMYLGHKYNVVGCLETCTKFLKNSLNEENICWGYKLAITYDQENLKRFCETIIGLKTKEVLASDGFLDCDFKVLSRIVMLKSLACSESELFEACMQRIETLGKEDDAARAAAKCETKKLIKVFRFGTMSIEEWTRLGNAYNDLFSYDEYREIVQLIVSKDFRSTKINLNRKKRIDSVPYDEEDEIECYRLISKFDSSREYLIKNIETTTFSTNQTVLLTGFTCDELYEKGTNKALSKNIPTEYTISEVPDSSDRVVLCSRKEELKGEVTSIKLDEPILIKAGLMYEIQLKQSPPEGCWSGCLLEQESEPDFIVEFYDDKDDEDYVSRGLIYSLDLISI